MSYIGQQLPADVFSGFTTDSFTGDGSATTFTLSKAPFSENGLIVVINNVIQKPTTNFTVSGTTLTIVGTAVASGDVIYATHISGAVPSTLASKVDVNGVSDSIILDADADTTISADTDDQIDFKTGGTDRLTIQSTSGNNVVVADGLTLTDGNLIVASGHGIDFSATGDGSGTTASELFDNYEEGTVTLAMSDSSTSFTMASGFATGYYTRIGDRVYVNGYIKTTSINSASSGDVKVTGLPFTSKSTNNSYASVDVGYQAGLNISSGTPIGGFVNINGTQFYITTGDSAAGISNMTATEWSNDGEIVFSLNYIAA